MASMQDNLKMIRMLQSMDMQEQQLAIQQETQRRLMAENQRKQQIRSGLANAVQGAASSLSTGGDLGLDPTSPEGRAQIFQESGQDAMLEYMIPQMAAQGPEGLKIAQSLMTEQRQQQGDSGNPFGGLTPDQLTGENAYVAYSYIQQTGKSPTTPQEWQQALEFAYGPGFEEGRQNFANVRTSGKYKFSGMSEDGQYLRIQDPKTGQEFNIPSLGMTTPQAKTFLDEGQMKSAGQFMTLNELMSDAEKMYDPAFVGLIDENARKIGRSFVDMPAYTMFRQKIDQMIELAYEISGKQLSDKEREYIFKAFLPQPGWSEDNYKASTANFKRYLRSRAGNRIKLWDASGKVVPPMLKDFQQDISQGMMLDDDALTQAYQQMGQDASEQDIESWLLLNNYDVSEFN